MLCYLPLFLLVFSGTVIAGGAAHLINRDQPLHWVPGVLQVSTVPERQLSTKAFRNALTIRTAGQQVQVFVITSATPDGDSFLSVVDTIMVWVPTTTASEAQKQALINVARTYLRGCFPEITPHQLAELKATQKTDWRQKSWQEKTVRGLKIGWSGGRGFAFVDDAGQAKYRAVITLTWPAKASRCQF